MPLSTARVERRCPGRRCYMAGGRASIIVNMRYIEQKMAGSLDSCYAHLVSDCHQELPYDDEIKLETWVNCLRGQSPLELRTPRGECRIIPVSPKLGENLRYVPWVYHISLPALCSLQCNVFRATLQFITPGKWLFARFRIKCALYYCAWPPHSVDLCSSRPLGPHLDRRAK
jgi:hypothetical protein